MINSSDAFEGNEPLPFPGETHALQPVVDKSSIANAARMQVVDDIEDIKALAEREGQVVIVNDDVVKRARTLARAAAKGSNPTSHDEYRQLQERYLTAYFALFNEEKKLIAKDLKCFPDTKAINLARKARADRKKYTFPSSGKGPFHQRDLAVVSALYELGLCQDLESYLEQIHEYVDTYEEAFRNPKEEVVWPQATFETASLAQEREVDTGEFEPTVFSLEREVDTEARLPLMAFPAQSKPRLVWLLPLTIAIGVALVVVLVIIAIAHP